LKLNHNIGFFAVCLMFLSSCSSIRHVPDDEYLLKRARFKIENSESDLSRSERVALRNDFTALQRQAPNSRFVMMPLRLWMYNSVNPEKDNRYTRFMQKAGEAPVVFDSASADLSIRQMQQYLVNKGFFNSELSYVAQTARRPQRMNLVFEVNPRQGYRYRNVSIDVRDDSLGNLFNDWTNRTLLKSGDPYSVDILDDERARIVRRVRNSGFWAFNRDNVEFLVDSSLNAHQMDIIMIVNPPKIGGHHEKYTFADVYIFPDERANRSQGRTFDTTTHSARRHRTDTLDYHFIHSRPLQIKPQVIASKLLIQPGAPYNLNTVERTYENLLDLRVFRSTNISVQPQPIDTNNPNFLLNTIIEVQQAPVNMWATEFEVTNASSLQGTNISTSFQNRNLFGGAEIFSLRLRGLVEVQHLFNKNKRDAVNARLLDNFDVGISANLDFPRFITPFYIQRSSVSRARTQVSLGYSYRYRWEYYNRQVIGASFAYSWRQPRVSHTLFPLDINWVNISLTDDFQTRIDSISKANMRLQYQYKNHFIFASRYSFSFSGQQGSRPSSFNAFRFSIESSGNSLYLLSNLLNAPKTEEGQYRFLGLAYAQYIRTDADFRRYWHLTGSQFLVTRLMGGVGFAYGNSDVGGSKVLPYEKGFFAGGNNNIRAWPMNLLGPGSFDAEMANIERIGDIVLVGNVEYRFPIRGAFKGALFVDAGNIWIRGDNDLFPNGNFEWKNVPTDLAVGGGVGLRWDLNFFVLRLDAAAPLRNPAKPNGEKWVIDNMRFRDFVLNFGIGYPF